MCKHELQHLIGTEDGIKCRNCGKIFKSFAEIQADAGGQEDEKKDEIEDVPKSELETAATEKDGDDDKDIKKEKKTAVPAKGSSAKTAKTTKKTAVSKK